MQASCPDDVAPSVITQECAQKARLRSTRPMGYADLHSRASCCYGQCCWPLQNRSDDYDTRQSLVRDIKDQLSADLPGQIQSRPVSQKDCAVDMPLRQTSCQLRRYFQSTPRMLRCAVA